MGVIIDLEILHSNIELDFENTRTIGIDYLKGANISWGDLNNHFDADRDKTPQIKDLVEGELRSRATARVNLFHWPGAGGTTVARRVAWDLRRKYPTVLLKRITPGETISRFRRIFHPTGQPILAVAEGGDITSDQLEKLYNEVKAENLSCVFLIITRRFEIPKEGKRTLFIGTRLSLRESHRFAQAFARVSPSKLSVLERISSGNDRERTPFHYALATFERDYSGLTRYVEYRITNASTMQKELLTYLSLGYYYGHKPIIVQLFTKLLGLPPNRLLRLQKILGEPQLELLIEVEEGVWRPAHQLIAEQILQIMLTGNSGERRNWKRNLPLWSINFIKTCGSSALLPSNALIDLLRRVFILRDETELLGTESSGYQNFSRLIEDVQTDEGRLSIFKELVAAFPEEAHFGGHLGRLYSIKMNEPTLAIKALEKAIILSPRDATLFHMKGMAWRKVVYNEIDELKRVEVTPAEVPARLRPHVEDTLKAFSEARELDDSEHSYISPVQMIIRVLDFGFLSSGQPTRSRFLATRSKTANWYRELLDIAESLMENVRQAREGERPSQYILSCEANLSQIYDDYSRALQEWDSLLSRTDVYAPPIRRQIARTLLAKQSRQWFELSIREIERIVELMEQNLKEEPNSATNIRLWFRAIRYSRRDYIDNAIDRLSQWRATGDSVDAYYYLYVLHVLKAIEGSTIERIRSEDLINQSRARSRNQRNRTISHEWLGKNDGLQRLVNSSELGVWDEEKGFYEDVSRLERVEGRVTRIIAPESGTLELASCGLPVFFVPAVAKIEKGRDENARVSFYLGFSYEGLRAWSLELIR